jgi:transketolase
MLSRRELANAIRALSMDAVEKANSGHPGAPMGMADIAEVLWNDFLRHSPANPHWPDRDRFIMSNGHGSMLLYSIMHLTGYDLSMDEIKRFRQLHSKTPGHPEYGYAPGIETTTGPLGQGFANAVGMALAERNLAAEFNRDEFDIVNHHTYVSVGDGCLMEGISHEAASLAGTLKLGKLITIFDSNQVSIDGDVSGWFTDDTAKRFEAYGWHVIRNVDGHDPEQIKKALRKARKVTDKPSLICCHTIIGWGSPNKQGKASCHGAPLGKDEVVLARKQIGWQYDPFVIPDDYYAAWDARRRGKRMENQWKKKFQEYKNKYPELAAEFERRMQKELPANWETTCAEYIKESC